MNYPVITFIGAGNMASSLIGGLIANDYPPERIWATNPSREKLDLLKKLFAIRVTQDNREGAKQADVLVFAVKPPILKSVIEELKNLLQTQNPLVISIVTGISCDTIKKWSGCASLGIVRGMPNTPALLRCGITGLYANSNVSEDQHAIAESILRAVGVTLWFKNESELNTVTALSGSGPAYFFLIMEAMLECGQEMGLDPEKAELLTVNTALGAARMALESGKDLHSLRRQVTSPGGTTEKAIQVLESGKIRELFLKALHAAKNRAIEMSNLLD